MLFKETTILLLVLSLLSAARGEDETTEDNPLLGDTANDAKSLRELIQTSQAGEAIQRDKSPKTISEVSSLKDTLMKAAPGEGFSTNLTNMLKSPENALKAIESLSSPILGIGAAEAIADPNINVIDSHVSQIIENSGSRETSFLPDDDEMKTLAKERFQDTNFLNLYRESLQIKRIHEEPNFLFGEGVQKWKHLSISDSKTLLIGRATHSIVILVGYNRTYERIKTVEFDIEPHIPLHFEVLKIFDSKLDLPRNFLLVAIESQITWYEIFSNDIREIHKMNILKDVDAMVHFTLEGRDILLVVTKDQYQKVQAEFIEFNIPDSEFWVIQTFRLPICPTSMAHLDLGKDYIVAFTQEHNVTIYRHQFTKDSRGKFTHFKTIQAANVSSVSGFRIGGYSYLAIGGDQPQILRYADGNFVQQTILSQTFGFVEGFFPVIVRTYRDDLFLLVQHRIELATHSVEVVDALIWNGIAFESSLSVPCEITSDPSANGFSCMLDVERDTGLIGATAIHHPKENGLYFLVPRAVAHSGMFKVDYEIVEAEDPLSKNMEKMKMSIEFISKILEYEQVVQKDIEEALGVSVDPNHDFSFNDLQIDEIETDLLEFLEGMRLESDSIEFLNTKWTHDDFLVDLDKLERTIQEDEEKLRAIDIELNRINRVNRQTQETPRPPTQPDSQIYNLGTYYFNGQLDPKSMNRQMEYLRQRRQIEPIEQSRVSSLTVKNIDVETINGIPVSNLVFLSNGQLVIPDSNVTFLDNVEARDVKMLNNGRINGVDFSNEILVIDSPDLPKNLVFENLIIENLEMGKLNNVAVDENSLNNFEIPVGVMTNLTAKNVLMSNDLNIETINEMSWAEFSSKLVPKHIKSSINEMTVEGNVFVVGESAEININRLSNAPFPHGFVLRNGPQETVIRGKKSFVGDLVTEAIDMDGNIDGIDPLNVITLDEEQKVSAETTFKVLEVLNKLEVNGTIAGRQLNDFLPNPTLSESKNIAAACSFKELIVRGPMIVEGSLNRQNLEEILGDIVYETHDDSEVVITATKVFTDLDVQGDVSVSSNFVNDLNLDSVVTTEGDQVLLINELRGQIFFSNLKTSGLFDGINATELEHGCVRTFGDQFIETPLVINGRVGAKSADVKESLNLIPVGDFMTIDQPVDFSHFKMMNFNDLEVETLRLNGDVVGTGSLINLNVTDVFQNCLSKSRKQTILPPVNIKSLTTNGTFNSKSINKMNFDVFVNYMKSIKNFRSEIFTGEQKIDNLIVDGNVKLKTINDKDFDQIIAHVIWLNRPNDIKHHLKFMDSVTVKGNLNINGNINKRPFKVWAENWLSRNEKTITIHSQKTFNHEVTVKESLKMEIINEINFEDLLMAKDIVQLPHLNIIGTVNVDNLKVEGLINRKIARELTDFYSYDAQTYVHTVNSDVHFSLPTNVEYLETRRLNMIDVNEWFSNLIRTDESNVFINGHKTFVSQFDAVQGFYNDFINDVNTNFLEKIILLSDHGEIKNIYGNLAFRGRVFAKQFGVKKNLITRFISSCDTWEWKDVAMNTNKDNSYDTLWIKSNALMASNLTTRLLNRLPFESILTLNTNQKFKHNVIVNGSVFVEQGVTVLESVNGMKLEHEHENTVMKNAQYQDVTVKTYFSGARVVGDLKVYAKCNSQILQNAVLLDSSPTIESPVNFKSLQASSFYSNYTIAGVNFDKWYDNVLWARGKEEQVIFGNWDVKKLHLTDDATGNGLINDVSIHDIEGNLQASISSIDSVISNHSVTYQELCRDLSYKANESQSSIYILKHFELDFIIREAQDIFSYFTFESPSRENFLAVNTNCTTGLYKWIRGEERFEKVGTIETGVVYDWLLVNNAERDIFIVTNSRMEVNLPCRLGGLNVWKMHKDQLFHFKTISKETDILELHINQQQPERFFALNDADEVSHYDIIGDKKEVWKLPEERFNYSFIPPEVSRDLRLFNGRNIFNLESKFKSRQARWAFDWPTPSSPILQHQNVETKPGDSPITIFKMPPGNLTIPRIPSKPLVEDKSLVSKIREIGDAVRQARWAIKFPTPPSPILQQQKVETKPGDSPITIFKMPPGNLTIPRIPSKPLVQDKSLVSKIRDIGDAVRKSLDDTFKDIPKLKIKNLNVNSSLPMKDSKIYHIRAQAPGISSKAEDRATTNQENVEAMKEISTESMKLSTLPATSQIISKVITQAATEKSAEFSQTSKPETSSKLPEKHSSPSVDSEDKIIVSHLNPIGKAKTLLDETPHALLNVDKTSDEDPLIEAISKISGGLKSAIEGARGLFSNLQQTAPPNDDDVKLSAESSQSTVSSIPISSTSATTISITDPPTTKTKASTTSTLVVSKETTSSTVPPVQELEPTTAKFRSTPFKESSIPVMPRIFFPPEKTHSTDQPGFEGEKLAPTVFADNEDPRLNEENEDLEPRVPFEVLTGGHIIFSENSFIPEHGNGEFIMMNVGPRRQKQQLFAVTRTRDSIIKGNHNMIEIFYDIFEGSIYQYIHCTDPSNLVTLQFRDETLLAFLEGRHEIHVYIYRGVQGFVGFKRIALPGYANQMTSLTLPSKINYKCDQHYLLVRMETEILFYGVKVSGNCGLSDVRCDSYY